jgi:hypothetical protein
MTPNDGGAVWGTAQQTLTLTHRRAPAHTVHSPPLHRTFSVEWLSPRLAVELKCAFVREKPPYTQPPSGGMDDGGGVVDDPEAAAAAAAAAATEQQPKPRSRWAAVGVGGRCKLKSS